MVGERREEGSRPDEGGELPLTPNQSFAKSTPKFRAEISKKASPNFAKFRAKFTFASLAHLHLKVKIFAKFWGSSVAAAS